MAATAEDAGRLLVRIEASQAKFEKQMAAIAKKAASGATDIENRFKKANDNAARSFEAGSRRATAATRQSGAAVTNLSFQLNDIAQGLAMGTSPFTLMMQQGSQVTQALARTGGGLGGAVKALGGAFMTMINPVSLATFAIIGLSGAAVQYFMGLGKDTADANEVIKGHTDLIRRIKDAYGDAAVGAETYSGVSRKLIEYDTRQTVEQYKATLVESARTLSDAILDLPASTFEGATHTIQQIDSAVSRLQKSVEEGNPDIQGFINRLIDIEQQEGTPQAVRDLIKEIIATGKSSAEVQGKLAQLTSFINGVGKAASQQTAHVTNFRKAVTDLANIALPALSEMEQAVDAYKRAIASANGNEFLERRAQQAFDAAKERIRTSQLPVPTPRVDPYFDDPSGVGGKVKKTADSFDQLNGSIGRFVQQVVGAESGGDRFAKNSKSTATGLGQFIESTWLRLFKENFPDRAKNMADSTILALRTDADISRKLIEAYASENAALLRQAGVAVNEAALHLAHFLGPQGAVAVLTAEAGTPVSQVLSQKAIAANPSILGGGATVDDVIAYGNKRANILVEQKEAAKALKLEMKELNQEAKAWADLGRDVLGGFIQDLRNGVSAADALKNALSRVADSLLNMALNGLFGGGGRGGLFGGAIIPGILHSGGVAGRDGYGHGRALSPSTFAGARRYHKGGVAGLMPGEVPAILQRGEVVIPKGGARSAVGQSIVINAPINAPGADAAALARVERSVQELGKNIPKMVDQRVDTRQTRGTRA